MTLNNKNLSNLSDLQPLTPWCTDPLDVNVLMLGTRDSSGFYSVQSTLMYKVLKEDKDAHFSCEVSFFVPGAIRTVESSSINITVHCESRLTTSSPTTIYFHLQFSLNGKLELFVLVHVANVLWSSVLSVFPSLSVSRPHHYGGAVEGVAPGTRQRGGHRGATLSGRWQPPSFLHFQQRTSENA